MKNMAQHIHTMLKHDISLIHATTTFITQCNQQTLIIKLMNSKMHDNNVFSILKRNRENIKFNQDHNQNSRKTA